MGLDLVMFAVVTVVLVMLVSGLVDLNVCRCFHVYLTSI